MPEVRQDISGVAKHIVPDRKQLVRDVYSAVFTKFGSFDGTLLIASKTFGFDHAEMLRQFPQQLQDSYRRENEKPADIAGPFDVYKKIEFVEVGKNPQGSIPTLKKKFRDSIGLVRVSGVGMTDSPDEQLLYVGYFDFHTASSQSYLMYTRYDPTEKRPAAEWIEVKQK